MKQSDLERYLEEQGYNPILAAGSHVKYVKKGCKMHILVKRRRPNFRVGAGLIARVKRIVEVVNA